MKYIVLLIISIFTVESFSQKFEKHISILCADSLNGRFPGTDGEEKALKYIQSQLPFYFIFQKQKFEFLNLKNEKCFGVNLFCLDKTKSFDDSTILLVSHYDHLGNGQCKSLEILESKRHKMHPGADDNASGVSIVIELGNWLIKQNKSKYKIALLFTSAHEVGLFGSDFFVKNMNLDSLKIKAVINFDMVGRLDTVSKTLTISDNQRNIEYYKSVSNSLQLIKGDLIQNSDLKYFENFPLHLISFTTGNHKDYHRISDSSEKINYSGMSELFDFFKLIILKI
jgi:hypothetical protein